MILDCPTPAGWLDAVLADFDTFLLDHAANERKASAMAMSMVTHYPDRARLCEEMVDLALEELNHFRQVFRLIRKRNLQLGADHKDAYVNKIRDHIRQSNADFFLDRLLTGALIEARGAERFQQISEQIADPDLQVFYTTLAKSEANHHQLFVDLAYHYFDQTEVTTRLTEWTKIESEVMLALPLRARLH